MRGTRYFEKDAYRSITKKLKKLGLTQEDIASYDSVKVDPPKGYTVKHKRVVVQTKAGKFYIVYEPPVTKVKDA